MKILILANNDVGLYQFRGALIQRLLETHEVVISLPYGPLVEPLTEAGCRFIDTPIDRRGMDPRKDLKLLRTYEKLLKAERPDLTITYTIKPNIYGGMACRRTKIPYAVNITGLGTAFQGTGILRRSVTMLYKIALKGAKTVFFENSADQALFIDEGIVPESKTRLLPGAGVELEKYHFAPYPRDGQIHFLFVGRVMKEKGIGELFQAMERLHREGAQCCLDVLGLPEEDMDRAIARGQKEGWLNYHGYQKDVRPFIEKAHCFVLPSYHEGMANTNLECAAMGRPLITSNIPGCREAVTEGSGLLCQPKDADSLYAAMRAFLALPHEEKAAMGRAGRAHMEATFDKKKVVEMTIHTLE